MRFSTFYRSLRSLNPPTRRQPFKKFLSSHKVGKETCFKGFGAISHGVSAVFWQQKILLQSLEAVPKCALEMTLLFPDCGNSRVPEEDGGFGIYGDKTRYATLQKKRGCEANSTVVTAPRGYETMRNLRTSIPSLVR